MDTSYLNGIVMCQTEDSNQSVEGGGVKWMLPVLA